MVCVEWPIAARVGSVVSFWFGLPLPFGGSVGVDCRHRCRGYPEYHTRITTPENSQVAPGRAASEFGLHPIIIFVF